MRRAWLVLGAVLALSVALVLYGEAIGPRLESASYNDEKGYFALRFNRIPDTSTVANSLTLRPALAVRRQWQGAELRLYPQEGLPSSGTVLVEGKAATPFAAHIPVPQYEILALHEGVPYLGQKALTVAHAKEVAIALNTAVFLTDHEGKKEVVVYEANCDCTQSISATDAGWDIRQAVVSGDGQRVLIHQLRPTQQAAVSPVRLWMWNKQTRKVEAFWFQDMLPDGIWPTPEGAGVILREAGRMFYVPFEPNKGGEVTFLGKYDRLLSIAADGGTLLFGSYRQDHLVLHVVQLGKEPEEITLPDQEIEEATLSPDGGVLYILARAKNSSDDPSTPRQLWSYLRMNRVATPLIQDILWSVKEMALAPNGREVAFTRRRPVSQATQTQLAVLDLATENIRTLTELSDWSLPSWIRQ